MSEKTYDINKRSIPASHLEKVFFPASGITKGDIVEYYYRIAGVMLPYLKDRPLNMLRAPEGMKEEPFFQQDMPKYFPEWIASVVVPKREKGTTRHVVCNNAESLLYLAGQACITFHIWLCKAGDLEKPDRIIFDLDPPEGGDFPLVRFGAQKLKEFFDEIKVETFVMTTGSSGLHVVIPLTPSADFDETRILSRDIAEMLVNRYPGKLTVETAKENREGKLFLDYLRNSYGHTSVSPYSVRLKENAPVAAPLEWDEIEDPKLTARSYTIENIFRRLSKTPDPWKNMKGKKGTIDKIRAAVKNPPKITG
ncbi:MAG: non-homologous end-joining DNA ligase [Chloroflexi bacterium]|nr:non-homologous end-joining DNA ligase [Chloroflexota bacterium]